MSTSPKRWWFRLIALVVLASVLTGFLVRLFVSTPISQATCDRIRVGMTQRDVEILVSRPVTWDALDRGEGDSKLSIWAESNSDEDFVWGSTIAVWFDKDGKVAWARFEKDKRSLVERLKSMGRTALKR